MAMLKVPSLQHLARNWYEDADLVRRSLVQLALHPPQFSYDPLFGAIRDLLLLGTAYEQIEDGIRKGVKRPFVQAILLEVLPLIRDHFDGIVPDYPPQEVSTRIYRVARDLNVPFKPPLLYGLGGQLRLPWFSFWRGNALAGRRLSMFVTIVDELMREDPDLERARLQILDFSIPKGEKKRLVLIDGRDIPRLGKRETDGMLEIWAEGFRRAAAELAGKPEQTEETQERDDRQQDLFPDPDV